MDQRPDTLEAYAGARDTAVLTYGPDYYRSHCGPVPYERNDHWLGFFGTVADMLVRAFAPRRVFDAGCAIGLLVESFWDRGVEASGRDISEWAVSQARADIRPYCQAGSIADPIPDGFDLLCCIEVLEHMTEADADAAIRAMAAAAPVILFSSSPVDLDEPTHVNVRPPIYWLRRWAEAGFAPSVFHDAGYLAPHAYVLERSDAGHTDRELAAFADRVRHRVALAQVGAALAQARAESAYRQGDVAHLREEAARHEVRLGELLAQAEALRAERAASRSALEEATQSTVELENRVRSLADDAERHRTDAAAREASLERHRKDLTAAHATAAALREQAQQAREEAQRAREEAQASRATAEDACTEAAAAVRRAGEREGAAGDRAANAQAARAVAEQRLQEALEERQVILGSSTWRATAGLRRIAGLVPRPVRRAMRGGARLAWWIATLRLRRELKAAEFRRALAGSPFFDPGWYLANNPDVAASGLQAARHYALFGATEGRDPGPRFSVARYLQRHPEAASTPGGVLRHAFRHGTAPAGEVPVSPPALPKPEPVEPEQPRLPAPPSPPVAEDALAPTPDARQQLDARFPELSALPVFAVPGTGTRRLTVVTDSIGTGSLYGGVGTALILAALLAGRTGATLRLLTRTEPAGAAAGIGELLRLQGIPWSGSIETVHAPHPGTGAGPGHDVPVGPEDWFLATSWWTTWATRRAVPGARIAHLLQEDERMFYPLGDERLRCAEILADPGVLRVVNSHLLLDHLRQDGMAGEAVAFEPSFPRQLYHPGPPRNGSEKRRFFFYARPFNARNLYWRGLEALCAVIEDGTLDGAGWEFHFAGHGVEPLSLPRGIVPAVAGPMAWKDYAAFVRGIDLGLSLMYTPHPSYPPLDLAASGAVVVTNRFANKQDLSDYSANILCADLDVPSLAAVIRRGAVLSADKERRNANFAASGLQRDWSASAAPVLDRLAAWMEG